MVHKQSKDLQLVVTRWEKRSEDLQLVVSRCEKQSEELQLIVTRCEKQSEGLRLVVARCEELQAALAERHDGLHLPVMAFLEQSIPQAQHCVTVHFSPGFSEELKKRKLEQAAALSDIFWIA